MPSTSRSRNTTDYRASTKTGTATDVSFQHSAIHSSPSLPVSLILTSQGQQMTWDIHDQFRKKFKLGHLNLNSLRYKFGHIAEMLNDNLVQYIAITETKIDNSFPDSQFIIPNYIMYRITGISMEGVSVHRPLHSL